MSGLTLDQLLAFQPSVANEELHWSLDGSEVRFVSSSSGEPELWSVSLASGLLKRVTVGKRSRSPRRSPVSDAVAYVSDMTSADEVRLHQPGGAPDVQLTRLGGRIEGLSWSPDGTWLVVGSHRGAAFDVYRVEVPGGRTFRLTNDDQYNVNPSVTPDGATVLFVRLNDDWTDHDVVAIDAHGGSERVIVQDRDMFDYHYGREFGYPIIAPDGKSFLFRSYRSGRLNYWAAPVDGMRAPWPVAPADADQYDAAWSPDGHRIAYVENHNGTLALRIADAFGGGELDGFGPEPGVCARPCWSPDGRRLAYLQGTPAAPTELWIVDLNTGQRRQLTSSAPADLGDRLSTPAKIAYKSFDGRDIAAYHYPPAAQPGERMPLLVIVHGGPTSQFMDSFNLQAQFFAACGYHVLLPNVRGSSGYGREFEDLNNGDWGHGDLRDVLAGVAHLRRRPDVDPERTAIMGTSYGGILTMAATVWAAPGVFQAAVPCSGYCEFVFTVGDEELRNSKQLYYEFGKLPEARAIYERCSPIYWAQQAATPCFIIQGEGLYPGSHSSKDFALALEAAYKPFWFKAYQGESYYVSSRANVRQMLLDIRMFLDFYVLGVPHAPLNVGDAPLTRLNGVIPYRSWLSTLPFVPPAGGPRYGIEEVSD